MAARLVLCGVKLAPSKFLCQGSGLKYSLRNIQPIMKPTSVRLHSSIVKCVKGRGATGFLWGHSTRKVLQPGLVFQRFFQTSKPRYIHPIVVMVAFAKKYLLGNFLVRFAFLRGFSKIAKELGYHSKEIKWGLLAVVAFFTLTHFHWSKERQKALPYCFTDGEMQRVGKEEAEQINKAYKDKFYKEDHEVYVKVKQVAEKLAYKNRKILPKILLPGNYKLHVIDEPDIANALVLPSGDIYIFSGLLKVLRDKSQLATVLAHEMAHVALRHPTEKLTHEFFNNAFLLWTLAVLWVCVPSDFMTAGLSWFLGQVTQYLKTLPNSRAMEDEADKFGYSMVARACFDVRHCSNTWNLMRIHELQTGDTVPEWFSSHPDTAKRADKADELIPQLMKERTKCCGPLLLIDPRAFIKKERQELEERLKEAEEGDKKQEASEQNGTSQQATEDKNTPTQNQGTNSASTDKTPTKQEASEQNVATQQATEDANTSTQNQDTNSASGKNGEGEQKQQLTLTAAAALTASNKNPYEDVYYNPSLYRLWALGEPEVKRDELTDTNNYTVWTVVRYALKCEEVDRKEKIEMKKLLKEEKNVDPVKEAERKRRKELRRILEEERAAEEALSPSLEEIGFNRGGDWSDMLAIVRGWSPDAFEGGVYPEGYNRETLAADRERAELERLRNRPKKLLIMRN